MSKFHDPTVSSDAKTCQNVSCGSARSCWNGCGGENDYGGSRTDFLQRLEELLDRPAQRKEMLSSVDNESITLLACDFVLTQDDSSKSGEWGCVREVGSHISS